MMERSFKKAPDFEHLRRVLMREATDGPVPLLEILADPEIMSEVTEIPYPADRAREEISQFRSQWPGERLPTPEKAELAIALMNLEPGVQQGAGPWTHANDDPDRSAGENASAARQGPVRGRGPSGPGRTCTKASSPAAICYSRLRTAGRRPAGGSASSRSQWAAAQFCSRGHEGHAQLHRHLRGPGSQLMGFEHTGLRHRVRRSPSWVDDPSSEQLTRIAELPPSGWRRPPPRHRRRGSTAKTWGLRERTGTLLSAGHS